MPRLVALKKLRYDRREIRAGETFEASEKDAKLLKAVKRAADAPTDSVMKQGIPDPVPVTMAAEDPEAPAVSRRGRYARRDMQATEARVMTTGDFPKDE